MEEKKNEGETKNEDKAPDIYEDIVNNNNLEGDEENLNENMIGESEIPRTTIKNVYGNNYDTILLSFKQIEEETKKYFKDVSLELDKKFSEFNTNIHKHFLEITIKLTEAFKLDDQNIDVQKADLIQKYTKEYLEPLSKIINMQKQILESIKKTISILMNSLDIAKTLNKEKPIQLFLEKEFDNIINSFLLIKLDIENFNFAKAINNAKIDDNFKDFISKVCQDKNFIMNIGPSHINEDELNEYNFEDLNPNDSIVLSDNNKNLTRLKIHRVRNADAYFNLVKDFNKLNYLKFNNTTFSDERNKLSMFKKCPKLKKLILNGAYNFDIKMLQFLSQNITKLILSNNNFVNYDFQNIMSEYLVKSDAIRRNLISLSFSNNSISIVDLESVVHNPKQSFYSLKELDFHKNKITKFNINLEYFNELKIINCCYNKFSRPYFDSYKNILTLLSGNLFLTEINYCKNYYDDIGQKLNNLNISLVQLSLSYLPKEFCGNYFSTIIINDNILITLKKLDLSYNDLNCDTLFTFINNNKIFINLKKLNLSGNKLDDTFFKRFLNLNLNNIFNRIQKINLSSNLIGDQNKIEINNLGDEPTVKEENKMDVYKLRLMYKFIEINKYLKQLNIIKNPISFKSKILTDTKIDEINKNIHRDKANHIIINCFYTFLSKINNELLKSKEEKNNRGYFNLKFDIGNNININSEGFDYSKNYIMFN